MALGTPVLGTAAVILVGLTSTPATPVGGLVSWTYNADTPTTARNYYGQATVNTVGATNRTIQFTLDYESGDAGQLILAQAVISKADVWVSITVDGTNGEKIKTKVTGGSVAGPDVNGYSTVSYTLVQQEAPTNVGGGFGT